MSVTYAPELSKSSAAGIGAFCGLVGTVTANTFRRLPVMRRPWTHVIGVLGCGYLGSRYVDARDWAAATSQRRWEERRLERQRKQSFSGDYPSRYGNDSNNSNSTQH
eukprot:TRINITY_DN15489_c0_g1_i2.p1 TRINITY_DN15489_c0_g1~~TRINITY_DN15489_c0_g1_i2.p1  ORF type:complete len:107 (+),score=11.00 TRINITY_DN15489_c0_g1_i2:80-400(+)